MQNKILIDADAIVSLVVDNDNGHNWALKESKKLLNEDVVLYLTNFAYGEVITVVSMRMGLKTAVIVAKQMEKGGYILVNVDDELRRGGLKWFAKQTSKNSRFTDCVNMAVMEKYGIKWIFSSDTHYKKNGFARLGFSD